MLAANIFTLQAASSIRVLVRFNSPMPHHPHPHRPCKLIHRHRRNTVMTQQATKLFGNAQALIDFRFKHGAAAFALVGFGKAQAVVLGPADGGDGAHQCDHRQGAERERVQCVVLKIQLRVGAAQAEEPGDQRCQWCP